MIEIISQFRINEVPHEIPSHGPPPNGPGGHMGGHMGGPPMQNQAPPQNQGDRFQAVTAYRFVGGSGRKVFVTYMNIAK